MEVNAQKIKILRTARAWTQQHLADACAISLRTVQRVERYGNASQETLLSLAAVLEVPQNEISAPEVVVEVIEQKSVAASPGQARRMSAAAFLGAILGAITMYFLMKMP